MSRVYLETSFVSACVTMRSDPASVYRREASVDWWQSERGRHRLFVSAEVIAELSHPGYPGRDEAASLVADLDLLVCMRADLWAPRIVTPEFLWEEEE